MNSTQCKSCGGQLNDGFDKCPHCGDWNNTFVDKIIDDFANAPSDAGQKMWDESSFLDKCSMWLIGIFIFLIVGGFIGLFIGAVLTGN